MQECLSYLGYGEGDFPATEQACECVLALPMFPEINARTAEPGHHSCANFVLCQTRFGSLRQAAVGKSSPLAGEAARGYAPR